MTIEEIISRRNILTAQSEKLWNNISQHSEEECRVINVLHNAKSIIDELDKTFEERTSLSKIDCSILMIATVLQLLRIYLLPKFQDKYSDEDRMDHDDEKIKTMVQEEQDDYKNRHQDWKSKKSKKGYRSWQEIAFTKKVPYDAQNEKDSFINMHGGQHRVKSIGHDPVLGWIFGVANILTDTITICPEYKLSERKLRLPMLMSYSVDMSKNLYFKETDRIPTWNVFKNSGESIKEDIHRLYAAVFSQGLHLASDKYTKLGLPIPFLSLLDSDTAYEIYKEGYDYLDYLYDTQNIRKASKSAALSITINKIIGCIHSLLYNPEKDFNRKLYHVRTRKVILYSNVIATSSDIIQTSIRAYLGDEYALKDFDLGGFLVTIYRLISDITFIQKVKEEFIFNEWDQIINNSNNILTIEKE